MADKKLKKFNINDIISTARQEQERIGFGNNIAIDNLLSGFEGDDSYSGIVAYIEDMYFRQTRNVIEVDENGEFYCKEDSLEAAIEFEYKNIDRHLKNEQENIKKINKLNEVLTKDFNINEKDITEASVKRNRDRYDKLNENEKNNINPAILQALEKSEEILEKKLEEESLKGPTAEEILKEVENSKKVEEVIIINEVEENSILEVESQSIYEEEYTKNQTKTKPEVKKDKKLEDRINKAGRNQGKKTAGRVSYSPVERKSDVIYYELGMTIEDVSLQSNIPIGSIIKTLFELGYALKKNDNIDKDALEIVAEQFNFKVKDQINENILDYEKLTIEDDPSQLIKRPPVVTIMGHVDHGKTTLLDKIRLSNVASMEVGAITQHIGAYQVKKNGELITFIDTPGHQAFTEMRARGAQVTDIVILVVAADDGVMPQTKEAIDHAKNASVSIIVAVNKIDKPNANFDRIKQELSNYGLLASDWGGDIEYVGVSALTGEGLNTLLDTIILVSEVKTYVANPKRLGSGVVLESRLDKGLGPVASVIVKNGTVKIGDAIVVGNTYGVIRSMSDEYEKKLDEALPSKAVEITGLKFVPFAGDKFMVFENEKKARLIAEERVKKGLGKDNNSDKTQNSLWEENEIKSSDFSIIIKTDVQGSIGAIKNELDLLDQSEVKIQIVLAGVGGITENDIHLASASNSVIIGFNIRPKQSIITIAKERKVEIRLYNIIYKLTEDINMQLKGMLAPVYEDKIVGEVEIRQIFTATKIGNIAGCHVLSGVIQKHNKIRLIRNSIPIYEGELASLNRGKDSVNEVKQGFECGIVIKNYNDIKIGDIIQAYISERVEVK